MTRQQFAVYLERIEDEDVSVDITELLRVLDDPFDDDDDDYRPVGDDY